MTARPYYRTGDTSLNRLRVMDLPGRPLPGPVRGRPAHELLASWGVAYQLQARLEGPRALELGLPDLPDLHAEDPASRQRLLRASAAYPRKLSELLAAGDAQGAQAARQLGQSLAVLLAALHRGDEVNRAANPHPAAFWDAWSRVGAVTLGGGLVSGELGQAMLAEAQLRLPKLGAGALTLSLSPEPLTLALRGAALGMSGGLVLDLGHTAVKLARVAGGELHLLPEVPAPHGLDGPALLDWLVALGAAHLGSGETLSLALAAYLTPDSTDLLAGQTGMYGMLAGLNVREELRRRLGAGEVRLYHDGTAAVLAVAGGGSVAALMLGTSVGWGLVEG